MAGVLRAGRTLSGVSGSLGGSMTASGSASVEESWFDRAKRSASSSLPGRFASKMWENKDGIKEWAGYAKQIKDKKFDVSSGMSALGSLMGRDDSKKNSLDRAVDQIGDIGSKVGTFATWGSRAANLMSSAGMSGAGVSALSNAAKAAGPVGAVIGAGVTGFQVGTAFNDYTKDHCMAGRGSDGKCRSWSDRSGDRGIEVHDWLKKRTQGFLGDTGSDILSHTAGIATVLGDSVAGTAATIASLPAMAGEKAWNGIKKLKFW